MCEENEKTGVKIGVKMGLSAFGEFVLDMFLRLPGEGLQILKGFLPNKPWPASWPASSSQPLDRKFACSLGLTGPGRSRVRMPRK